MTETINLTALILAVITTMFFTIKHLFFKKKEITIEISECNGCPFKERKEGMIHYNCKLRNIVRKTNDTFSTLEIMKMACPIKGPLTVTIK